MNREILEEASVWFVEFRVGDADATVRADFDDWLRRSPEHIRAYLEIAKTYVDLPPPRSDRKVDVQELIAYARSDGNVLALDRLRPPGRNSPPATSKRSRSVSAALAACIAALAVVGGLTWVFFQRETTYATDTGERRSITLDDGSAIELNARSKIRVHFSRAHRDVELLQGEALFEVARDKARPFVVKSGETLVTAVGTQFEVDRKRRGTTVTVVEGRVAVATESGAGGRVAMIAGDRREAARPGLRQAGPGAAPTYLTAGEQVTVSDGAVEEPRAVSVAVTTAWTRHQLIFEGSRLGDVIEDFNRYNTRQISIEDPSLEDLRISGVYSSTDPESLIRFLREQPGLRIIETDEDVRIARQ